MQVSNPLVAEVNRRGLVRGLDRGESAVIVRFANFIEAPLLTFVRDIEGFTWDEPEVPITSIIMCMRNFVSCNSSPVHWPKKAHSFDVFFSTPLDCAYRGGTQAVSI